MRQNRYPRRLGLEGTFYVDKVPFNKDPYPWAPYGASIHVSIDGDWVYVNDHDDPHELVFHYDQFNNLRYYKARSIFAERDKLRYNEPYSGWTIKLTEADYPAKVLSGPYKYLQEALLAFKVVRSSCSG